MVLLADRAAASTASWRFVYLIREESNARLSHYGVVFVLFIISSFYMSMMDSQATWFRACERLAIALTVLCCFYALTLPLILKSIIVEKYDSEITSKESNHKLSRAFKPESRT